MWLRLRLQALWALHPWCCSSLGCWANWPVVVIVVGGRAGIEGRLHAGQEQAQIKGPLLSLLWSGVDEVIEKWTWSRKGLSPVLGARFNLHRIVVEGPYHLLPVDGTEDRCVVNATGPTVVVLPVNGGGCLDGSSIDGYLSPQRPRGVLPQVATVEVQRPEDWMR